MNVRRLLWVALGVFIAIVLVAIGISARFTLSNITANPYGFIEDFFSQWSPALAAAGTFILAISIFSFVYENRRREEREQKQAIHSLHDEIFWNLNNIITLRFQISEKLKHIRQIKVSPSNPMPFELLETRVFDDLRSRGQLHLLEEIRMEIIPCYKLIRDYNLDKCFKPNHPEILATLHEWLEKGIKDLEAKFEFLPHYIKEKRESQEGKTADSMDDSTNQEHYEGNIHEAPRNILKEYIRFQALTYFIGSLLFMYLSGLSKQGVSTKFPIGNFEMPFAPDWVYVIFAMVLLAWTFTICIAPYFNKLMNVILKVNEKSGVKVIYFIITLVVFGTGWAQLLATMLNTGVSEVYFYIFFFTGVLLLGLIVLYPYYSHWKRKRGTG